MKNLEKMNAILTAFFGEYGAYDVKKELFPNLWDMGCADWLCPVSVSVNDNSIHIEFETSRDFQKARDFLGKLCFNSKEKITLQLSLKEFTIENEQCFIELVY